MSALQVRLLGDFQVLRENEVLSLPASKKTRALLAYLITTNRPQRRDRLCEMFWDQPDDPRGALRWSLSKLRQVVNDGHAERLLADRERVSFQAQDILTDVGEIEFYFSKPNPSARSLSKGLLKLRDPYLAGIDLPDQTIFSEWLASERERIAQLQARSTQRLIDHPDTPPDIALDYAKLWAEYRPYSREAANAVLLCLRRLGRNSEALQLERDYKTGFDEAGIDWAPQSRESHQSIQHSAPREPNIPFRQERAFLTEQTIKFCKTPSGVNIAYASVGSGPPLVKAANWLTHLELDWQAPIWSPIFKELASTYSFIRYDERGNGLSDWDVDEISFEKFVGDLEAVVDAVGLRTFPLLGISQGAAVSIEYAIRHPERVSKLIIFGGYPKGWRVEATPEIIREREAVMTLTRSGWGQDNPAYRQIFSTTFMPSATPDQLTWFDDFQRQTTSPENAVRFLSAFGDLDVRDRLAHVKVPTLIIHSRGDRRIPWEVGRDLAAKIPDASFVTLESDNHLLLGDEPASQQFVNAVRTFLEP